VPGALPDQFHNSPTNFLPCFVDEAVSISLELKVAGCTTTVERDNDTAEQIG
jgi:hypothetical protein